MCMPSDMTHPTFSLDYRKYSYYYQTFRYVYKKHALMGYLFECCLNLLASVGLSSLSLPRCC